MDPESQTILSEICTEKSRLQAARVQTCRVWRQYDLNSEGKVFRPRREYASREIDRSATCWNAKIPDFGSAPKLPRFKALTIELKSH